MSEYNLKPLIESPLFSKFWRRVMDELSRARDTRHSDTLQHLGNGVLNSVALSFARESEIENIMRKLDALVDEVRQEGATNDTDQGPTGPGLSSI